MRHYWHFDIDKYLNHFVPPPPWKHVPHIVSRFFGYRPTKPHDIGNLRPTFWAFIGVFCSLCILQVVGLHIPSFLEHQTPLVVGSFGAAAVLEFYAIESPLAQPRNAFLGQIIASTVGTGVCKLFLLSDHFSDVRWLGGALACAAAVSIMALTKTVHPPAGATALLAVVDDGLVKIGWFLIPVMLLGCSLMLAVALLVNNIERQFPIYWWTPESLPSYNNRPIFRRRTTEEEQELERQAAADIAREEEERQAAEREKQLDESADGSSDDSTRRFQTGSDLERGVTAGSSTAADLERGKTVESRTDVVIIRPGSVVVPEHMYLTQEEEQFLETLSQRL